MEIKTKFDIGQKVFWIDFRDGIYIIKNDPVSRINIGGEKYEEYSVGFTNKGVNELYTDFREAKVACFEAQKEHHERAMKIIGTYEKLYEK